MNIISNEIIKKMRIESGLSQDDMAVKLSMSQKQISHIETGKSTIDVWQLMSITELFGRPSEDFWLLYLDMDEFEGYRIYKQLKQQIRDEKYDDARATLKELEQNALANRIFIRQFLTYARVKLDESISHEDAIAELEKAIRESNRDFDEEKIGEYKLNYNEIYILSHLATRYSKLSQKERAIKIVKSLIEGRKRSNTTEDDRAKLFPALYFNLSNYLGQIGRIKESLEACEEAIKICREYNSLIYVPKILLNMASGLFLLGEEEHIWKTHLIRAYHAAYAFGNNSLGKEIKKYAKDFFGVDITE